MNIDNRPIDPDIAVIQEEWFARNRYTHRWVIVAELVGYSVHEHSIDGVAPPTTYPTIELAAARLLQLLGIKQSVSPQTRPEIVEITDVGI